MRKVFFPLVILLLAVANTACAQDVKTVADSIKSNMKDTSVKEAVTNIADAFKAKKAEAEGMIGTWHYVEPAVYATKGNLLYKLAGNSVANQLEKLLNEYVEKCEITPENCTFTFNSNGTFDRDVVGHKAHGVWMVGGPRLLLGINKILTADVMTHHDGDKLMFLIDVDKLLNILKLLGAMKDTKTNKTLIKLTKAIPTLQAGFSFQKVTNK